MKPEIKSKWVSALESGEYAQGQHMLRSRDDKFCCLGVLCDLYSKETGEAWKLDPNGGKYLMLTRDGYLPSEIMEWSGLKDSHGDHVVNIYHRQTLSRLNDNGISFKEIAQLIDKQL